MHPVLHGSVAHALVERICRQDQDEVTCPLYTLNQLVLEFTSLKLLHVYEDAVSSNLQVHLQKAWDRRENKKVSEVMMNLERTNVLCILLHHTVLVLTWPAGNRWSDGS